MAKRRVNANAGLVNQDPDATYYSHPLGPDEQDEMVNYVAPDAGYKYRETSNDLFRHSQGSATNLYGDVDGFRTVMTSSGDCWTAKILDRKTIR